MSAAVADLLQFDHTEAWRLGTRLVEDCRDAGHPVTVLVMLGDQRAFHAGLPGTCANRDSWVDRKARVVRHFGVSSDEVHRTYVDGKPQFFEIFGLSRSEFAPFGGAVPITVRGAIVGVLAISGLTSEEDHDLAIAALQTLADEQAADGEDSQPGE